MITCNAGENLGQNDEQFSLLIYCIAQRNVQLEFKLIRPAKFTLPDNNHSPTKLLQIGINLIIPDNIRLELCFPEINPGLWCVGISTVFVSVPETTMNKDNGTVTWQHNIRLTRQVFPVKTKPIPNTMEE